MKKFLNCNIFISRPLGIGGAAFILSVFSLASRLLGLLRERLLVGAFGTGDQLDAYFAAFQIPNFAFNLLISATLSVAFIPVFCEYLNRDKEQAWRVANSVLNLTIIAMGVLSAVFFVFAPYLVRFISPGFVDEKYTLTLNLTRLLLFSPWLFAVSAVFSGILNSFRHFLWVALAPLVYNLAIILGIIFLVPFWGIYGVVVGVLAGAFLHLVIQVPTVKKLGFVWRRVVDLKNRGVREILKLMAPRIFSVDISQTSQLVGTIIGSTLLVGSVAIFNLVYHIESVPIGIFAVSLAVSVFPTLSQTMAQGDRLAFKNNFSFTARQILFFLVPLAILSFIFRAQVVRLILGTRNLGWQETRLAAAALAIFAASFVAQGLAPLFARAFFALKNTKTPLFISLISIGVNVAASYGFLSLLENGGFFARGAAAFLKMEGLSDIRALALPFGFSAASLFNALLLILFLRRFFGQLGGRQILLSFLKFFLAGLASGLVGYACLYLIEPFLNTRTFLGILAQLVFATLFAGAAFIFASLALKSEEAKNLLGSLRRKIKKPKVYGFGEGGL